MKKKLVITFLMLIFAMGIAGCGEAGSVDTPTSTPEVTDTPTSTPTPTIALGIKVTATPAVTGTPTSTPTATLTPSASPTPMVYTSEDTVFPWIYNKYGCESDIASIIYYDEEGKVIEEITSDPNLFELQKVPKYAVCFNANKQQICTIIYDYNCEDTEGLQACKDLSTKEYRYLAKYQEYWDWYYGELAMTCTYVEYDPDRGTELDTFKKYIYAASELERVYVAEYGYYDSVKSNKWTISKLDIEDGNGEKIKTYSHYFGNHDEYDWQTGTYSRYIGILEVYDFFEEALDDEIPEYSESVTDSEYGKQERPETEAENVYFENGTLLDKNLDDKLKKLSQLSENVKVVNKAYGQDLSYNGICSISSYKYYGSYEDTRFYNDIYAYVNLETGKKLTLADLFYKDVNFVELINNEIKQAGGIYDSSDSARDGYRIDADQPFYIKKVTWTDEQGNENVSLYLVTIFDEEDTGETYKVVDGFILDPAVFAANGSFNVVDPEKVFEAGTYEVKKVTYPDAIKSSYYGFKQQDAGYTSSKGAIYSFDRVDNIGDKYNFIYETSTDTDTGTDIWQKYLTGKCSDASSELVAALYKAFDEMVTQEAAEPDSGEFNFCRTNWAYYCNKIFPCHEKGATAYDQEMTPIEYTYPADIYVNVSGAIVGEDTTKVSFRMGIESYPLTAAMAYITLTFDNDTYAILDTKIEKQRTGEYWE